MQAAAFRDKLCVLRKLMEGKNSVPNWGVRRRLYILIR